MPRVHDSAVWLLFVALLRSPVAPAQAQPSLFRPSPSEKPTSIVDSSRMVVAHTTTAALVVGGVLGGAVGLLAGGYAGAGIEALGECSEWCGFAGAILGGIVGESLGVSLGVHAFNRRQGQLLPSALSSLGIAAAGLLLLSHVSDSGAGTVLVWSVPVAQIATSILIERRSSG